MSRPGLVLERLSLRLGAFRLRALELAVESSEILVLLGPNGAGKSVTLETIAGFHPLEAGRIRLGGRDITDLPPERRHVGLLFQNFALFPHLTAAGNVALALRAARGAVPAPRITDLLGRFGIDHLAGRFPDSLSPGEKQRVALARALAGRPELFLFDEPFSALDAPTRSVLREALKTFLREAGVPALFVTHDLVEALALADRLALLRDGAIVQSGNAGAVYRAPADRFAAGLLGVENILDARLVGQEGARWRVAIGACVLDVAADTAPPPSVGALCLRAEDVALVPDDGNVASNRLAARITAIVDAGALMKISLDCGFPLIAVVTRREAEKRRLAPGLQLVAAIEPRALRLVV
ncbi:MAG TPA: ABC transporter ATP-binding protein [Stellaceae bacterium]|nr:ABC transporter ATP-binding protein [Stellaceae bacterium]